MYTVSKSQVMLIDNQTLMAEASMLGLPPGDWPQFIAVVDDNNEGFLFGKERFDGCAYTYSTQDGRFQLKVLND